MKFHLKKTIKVTLVIYPIFMLLVYLFLGYMTVVYVMFILLFVIFVVYLYGYFWIIDGDRISKYIFFKKQNEFLISEIKFIEAYRVKEVGTIFFYFGKGPHEDEYLFMLKNGFAIKSHAHCYNSNNLTIGRYLNIKKKVKIIEKTRYKILNT